MKKQWLELLCDPIDQTELHFEKITREVENEVMEADIKSASGNTYFVRNGIPSFVNNNKITQQTDSVSSFEFEWNKFGFLYAKKGWLEDIVKPLVGGEEYFKDKVIVDAGAGSGSQSAWMAAAGAKLVISLELSNGIYDMHNKTIAPYKDNVFPVQCDIAFPPIKIKPDVLYCVNVIQHTKSIKKTFESLCNLLDKKSTFLFNVYTQKESANIIKNLRKITTKLPFSLVYALSFLGACIAYPLLHIKILGTHSFKETWLDIYDLLGPHHFQDYMTDSDQLNLIEAQGLKILKKEKFGYLLAKK